mmetsp:Transcript_6699/g.12150  ORF Transcript_6699/g.12150 Transcript_6699/m.12150 type:complete len:546 (+) Transcript_6699:56-1693(+)
MDIFPIKDNNGKKCCAGCVGITALTALIFTILILASIKNLGEDEQLLIIKPDGRSVENGPGTTWVWVGTQTETRKAHTLSQTEYMIIGDAKTGVRRVQKGPGRFFLEPYEEAVESRAAKTLTKEEYMYVTDLLTGQVATVQGPQLYFPQHAYESLADDHDIIHLAEWEAIAIRKPTGSFKYYHGANHDFNGILEPEAEVVTFHWSAGADMETNVSKREVTKIDTRIQQLPFWFDDIRSKDNMEFELEGLIFWQITDVAQMVRSTGDPTSDIWHRLRSRIAEASTGSSFLTFLENASRVKDAVIENELTNHSDFYTSRGLTLYSFQLIEVELHSDELAKDIEKKISAAATERLNSIEKANTQFQLELVQIQATHAKEVQAVDNQLALEAKNAEANLQKKINEAKLSAFVERTRSENEILKAENDAKLKATQQNASNEMKLAELEAQKIYEEQRVMLLDLLELTARKEASSSGSATGLELGKSLEEYLLTLNESLPNVSDRVSLYRLHQEIASRKATTANLAGGKAQLYVTPENVNLNLGTLPRAEL